MRWQLVVAFLVTYISLHCHAADCDVEDEENIEEWVSNGGFIIYFVIVAMSFWGLAVVCEDFFVPALNLLCDDLKLDNDVAGATIMAAGNSSPELFACFVSLFVTNTALGAGTAVGSAIFNHLCICSGSVLYAKGGELQVEWRILVRECSFYGGSLYILVWALKGNLVGAFNHAFDHVGGHPSDKCLSVHWHQALVLVMGYILYALVCSNYRVIMSLLCPLKPASLVEAITISPEEALHIVDTTAERIGIDENGEARPVETYEAPIPLRPGLSLAHQQSFSVIQDMHRDSAASSHYLQRSNTLPGPAYTPKSRTYSADMVELSALDRPCGNGKENVGNPLHRSESEGEGVDEEAGGANDTFESPSVPRETDGSNDEVVPSNGINSARDGPDVEIGSAEASAPTFATEEERLSVQHQEAMRYAEAAARLTGDIGDDSVSSRVSYSPMAVPENATCECWMYKRSRFYSRIRVLTSQKWQLRYFRVDKNGLWYCRHDMHEKNKLQMKTINIFDAVSVYATDVNLFEFVIVTPKRKFVFRCSNEDDFMGMFSVLAKDVAVFKTYDEGKRKQLALDGEVEVKKQGVEVDHEEGAGHDLMTAPSGGFALLMHYVLFPLKAMLYYTIPEISIEQDGEFGGENTDDKETKPKYQTTIWMCIVWLAILSYVMNFYLEELGKFFGISSGTMGLTFGAAGTSFPNLLSSMIVAKQGLGNMAVSNAFGSNVFCIFFGLGFPWLIYILASNGEPYKGLKDDGIVFAVIVLLIVLTGFLVLLAAYSFKMKTWMGTFFLVLYGLYLLYAIAIG